MTRMKILASVLLGVILLVGICVYMQPRMSECPTVQAGTLCPIHDTGALSFWQRAIVLSRRAIEMATLVLVVPFVWFVMARARSEPGFQRLYDRLYLSRLPLSYLQELFSQGILHPKVY